MQSSQSRIQPTAEGSPLNLRFERTFDLGLLVPVLSTVSIWDAITDDGCPARKDFTLDLSSIDSWWAIASYDRDELLGLFLFEPRNHVEWAVHTCLLPSAWGARAHAAAQGVIEWIWAHTTCRRITTHVPAYNRLALRFAKQAGLTEYGVNPASWLKNGLLFSQIELGISKEL